MARHKRDAIVDPKLLDLLVCPLTKGPLDYKAETGELYSRDAEVDYPVRDGIAVMLPSEAQAHDDDVSGKSS